MRNLRLLAGLVLWVAAAAALAGWLRSPSAIDAPRLTEQLWQYGAGSRQTVAWESPQLLGVREGDPVFVADSADTFRQVGEVSRADGRAGDVLFYASAPPRGENGRLSFHETPNSMEWVFRTMLPAEKRELITAELTDAFEQHHEEILSALRPVVESALRDAVVVMEDDLPKAMARHDAELKRLGGKYEQEFVQEKLVPLMREEVWPIVREHAEPAVAELGRELWDRTSLWRFGWRYAYDVSPLPEKRLVEKEWQRFVDEEAVPVIEERTQDLIRLQHEILADVAGSEQVRQAVRSGLADVVQDPEAQRLFWQIIQETVVDNPRMREVFDEHWKSEQARQAFQLAAERFQPSVVRIGELMLGTREAGITPEFARVLRNQVLGKDRRWLVLHVSPESPRIPENVTLGVVRGSEEATNPFVRPRPAP